MKNAFLLFIMLCLSSCKNEVEEVIHYDKAGNISAKYYTTDDGKMLDSIVNFKNNIIESKLLFSKKNSKECYLKYYDKSGIVSEGNTLNKIKIGKWKFYASKSEEIKVVEFKNICGEEYPNQEWNYKKDGQLNPNLCSYYSFSFEKAGFKIGDSNILTIKYIPMVKSSSISTINFSNEIDSMFCNVDKVKKSYFRLNDSLTFQIPIVLDEAGKHNFRGYIEEHVFEEIKGSELSNHKTRRVYIDIPFEVK